MWGTTGVGVGMVLWLELKIEKLGRTLYCKSVRMGKNTRIRIIKAKGRRKVKRWRINIKKLERS